MCFNADWCCSFYKPRLIFVKLIIIFLVFFPTIFWLIQYSVFLIVDVKLMSSKELAFFAFTNPFLVYNDNGFTDDEKTANFNSIKYMLLNCL